MPQRAISKRLRRPVQASSNLQSTEVVAPCNPEGRSRAPERHGGRLKPKWLVSLSISLSLSLLPLSLSLSLCLFFHTVKETASKPLLLACLLARRLGNDVPLTPLPALSRYGCVCSPVVGVKLPKESALQRKADTSS